MFMADFIDKKEDFANLLESYLSDEGYRDELLDMISRLKADEDFKDIALFKNILNELEAYLDELSRKEIKQRILMIRSYMD